MKYGKPMVAAAPLLLALNLLPVPAHACTGNDDDPQFCANNNGQVINGFGGFFLDTLLILPGSTTVGEDGSLIYRPRIIDGEESFNTGNFTTGGGGGVSGSGVGSLPRFNPLVPSNGQQGAGTDELIEIEENPYQYYTSGGQSLFGSSAPSDDEFESDDWQLFVDDIFVFGPEVFGTDGQPADGLGTLLSGTSSGSSFGCSQSNLSACSQEFEQVFDRVQIIIDPEHRLIVLDALPEFNFNQPPDDDDLVVQTFNVSPDEDDGFITQPLFFEEPDEDDLQDGGDFDRYLEYYGLKSEDPLVDVFLSELVQRFGKPTPEDDDADIQPQNIQRLGNPPVTEVVRPIGGASSETASSANPEDAFVARQIASLRRLRDRAESETDPNRRAELEQRVQRIETRIQQFGSAALKAALQKEDSRNAPVPGRG
ncbi:MAG: hypothetical protein JJ899_09820 [Alphaproteobacteria bacterium]|nr:hypothetical protein [Alphaproteobacteria bacterium]